MIDSYFFVPGDKERYITKINSIKSDYIVVDLEDAVAFKLKNLAFNLVLSMIPEKNHFIRIPFFENCYSNTQIIKLIELFEGRIVVPKLSKKEELIRIKNLVADIDLSMIILIENPLCIINLNEILKNFSNQIHGMGFGSHDFCSITGIKHKSENLDHYKRQLVLYAKAYNINYIDGVDLNLKDFTQFIKESLFAFEIGASGKFLIHPSQINELRSIQYLTQEELKDLEFIYHKVKDIAEDDIEVYTIDDKVYEKPHIIRIKYLMNKINNTNYGSK